MKLKGYGKLRKNEKLYLQYTSKCRAVEVQVVNIPRARLRKLTMYLMHHSDSPVLAFPVLLKQILKLRMCPLLFLKQSIAVSDTVMKTKK